MQIHRRGRISGLGLILSLLMAWSATPAFAAEDEALAQAKANVEVLYAELLECMKAGDSLGLEGRRDKLSPAVDQAYDIPLMSAKVLGRHWRKLSDEDKSRWVETFGRLTVATYAERFSAFDNEQLIVEDAEPGARDTIVVHTRIVPNGKEPVPVHYRMREREGRWRVIDVFLNGTVSELALRRSEYGTVLAKEGMDPLIEQLEAKISSGKASADVAADLD